MTNEFIQRYFLYSADDNYHNSFKFVVTLKKKVDVDALREATDIAIQRYPYFSIKTQIEGSEIRIISNGKPLTITDGFCLPCLGTDEANNHFIALSYSEKSIFINIYHALTDGAGSFPFIKTLLYYYLTKAEKKALDPSGINLVDSEILPVETCDPYGQVSTEGITPLYQYKRTPVFHFNKEGGVNPCEQITHIIRVDEKQFMEFARANDGTPNATVAAMMYKAIVRRHPDIALPVVAEVAIDMRSAYQVEGNCNNLVSTLHLKYEPKFQDYDAQYLGTLGRGMIMLQSQPENLLAQKSAKDKMVQYLDSMSSHEERRGFYAARIKDALEEATFCVSYVGKVDWGSVGEYLESAYVVADAGEGGLIMEIFSLKNNFYLSCSQQFSDSCYIDNFMEMLGEEQIDYSYLGSISSNTPKVKIF